MKTTTITKTVFIKAAPEFVWPYLVDKDKLGEWFHPAKSNLSIGRDYELSERVDGYEKVVIWGKVMELEPPIRLVSTFNIAPFDGVETIVTWQLSEVAGGTRLLLSHDGVAEASGAAAMKMLMALDKGWSKHFQELQQAIPR
jgi:uncharacterized protein YndB with AHSA1/START domain